MAGSLTRGSIPAYAGDPVQRRRRNPLVEVYPRLRGGSPLGNRRPAAMRGLSPPTRGIHPIRRQILMPSRSIPAYAGDPLSLRALDAPLPVYPRLRGGSHETDAVVFENNGLSPPTRGILLRLGKPDYQRRSIPAYAGDPNGRSIRLHKARVYPRLRGGSAIIVSLSISYRGLSPPTRGILLRRVCQRG